MILSNNANAAALLATDKKPTMGADPDSYTSGTHIWKGTADNLNPIPIMIKETATKRMVLLYSVTTEPSDIIDLDISGIIVVPVKPNRNAIPYNITAELNALTTRNFKAQLVADLVKVNASNNAIGNPVNSKPT